MSEEDLLTKNNGNAADIQVEWRETNTVLVDSVVGYVIVAGIPRVTLGAVTHQPFAAVPKYLPTITIASSVEGLKFMAAQLLEIARSAEAGMEMVADGQSAE